MKSEKSLRSIRSTRSSRTLKGVAELYRTDFIDFENVLPMACAKFDCDYSIFVKKNQRNEIRLERLKVVPRVLLQIIGFLAPYYKNITKISIANCRIDGLSVYELSKIVKVSTVTQICLDGSPVAEANYAILLDLENLRQLSLSRCEIDDNVCEQLALKLGLSRSAEHLSFLNLSSNRITDTGARSIADSLRTNRYLRYLNLADNRITDDGAYCIFNVLKEFPLTSDEIVAKRQRYFKYLKERQALYFKYLNDTSIEESKKQASKRKKTSLTSVRSKSSSARKEKDTRHFATLMINDEIIRAEMLAKQVLGPFIDPFQPDCIRCKNEHTFCLGNMVLCYLNMSYNNLSYLSIKTLCEVLTHQKNIRKPPQTGLIKVVIDGNNIPIRCPEFFYISEMLSKIYQETMRLKRQSIIR
ncbi:leucine-rich repeat-containing protein 71-like isoform X2 [Colias croceus]|uniref:leucine-rich repeat-containing protein 71-like isoform X2 n=1 Tax=Colias crocea TaxID=72248 RepID=UPI001E27CD0D|nr:leucine-rich repeat-containing protein 71-like isoform X2 [Colias croceus]